MSATTGGGHTSGLLTFGLACIAAAIIGGGLKWSDIEIPVVGSLHRQMALGIFGLAVVAYAGHRLRTEHAAQDQTVTFSISDATGLTQLIERTTSVYLLGRKVAELHLTGNRPQHTATVTVPRPGTYAYRLEQTYRIFAEVYRDPAPNASGEPPRDLSKLELVGTRIATYHYTGAGTVDVSPGVAYKLMEHLEHGVTNLTLLPIGTDVLDHLTKISRRRTRA